MFHGDPVDHLTHRRPKGRTPHRATGRAITDGYPWGPSQRWNWRSMGSPPTGTLSPVAAAQSGFFSAVTNHWKRVVLNPWYYSSSMAKSPDISLWQSNNGEMIFLTIFFFRTPYLKTGSTWGRVIWHQEIDGSTWAIQWFHRYIMFDQSAYGFRWHPAVFRWYWPIPKGKITMLCYVHDVLVVLCFDVHGQIWTMRS